MFSYNRILFLIDHLIWAILIVVFIFFIFQSEHFLTERNISNILLSVSAAPGTSSSSVSTYQRMVTMYLNDFFSFVVAPVTFTSLDEDNARKFIRRIWRR